MLKKKGKVVKPLFVGMVVFFSIAVSFGAAQKVDLGFVLNLPNIGQIVNVTGMNSFIVGANVGSNATIMDGNVLFVSGNGSAKTYLNGKNLVIEATGGSGSTTVFSANGTYLFNNTNNIWFEEAYLNRTIAVNDRDKSALGPFLTNNSNQINFSQANLLTTLNNLFSNVSTSVYINGKIRCENITGPRGDFCNNQSVPASSDSWTRVGSQLVPNSSNYAQVVNVTNGLIVDKNNLLIPTSKVGISTTSPIDIFTVAATGGTFLINNTDGGLRGSSIYTDEDGFNGLGLTALGYNAGSGGIFPLATTDIGRYAGYANTGSSNVFVGWLAGYNGAGNLNVCLGVQSCQQVTQGANIFIGRQSGFAASGPNNVGIGDQSLFTVSGSTNTGIGAIALYNETGALNIGIGGAAGNKNKGDYNIFIGDHAGEGTIVSNVFTVHQQGANVVPFLFGTMNNNRFSVNTNVTSQTFNVNGSANITRALWIGNLSGSYIGGSAYVCVTDAGLLYTSETTC